MEKGLAVFLIILMVIAIIVSYYYKNLFVAVRIKNYRPVGPLMTQREKYIYEIINHMNVGQCFAKVRIADIITTDRQEYRYRNKINQKHIDILIVDRNYLPVLAIEVQDSTHHMNARIKRDTFVKEIFKEAEIPLLFIRGNDRQKITDLIQKTLNNKSV